MEKEKKDLSFILILLSTLIGIAVLFQWAIVNGLYVPVRNQAMGKTAGKGNHVPFPVCDTQRRISFSFSI